MPKISSKQRLHLSIEGEKTVVVYDVHYFVKKSRLSESDCFFFVIPEDQKYTDNEHPDIKTTWNLGRTYKGFKATTESEAVKKLKAHAEGILRGGILSTPFILILKAPDDDAISNPTRKSVNFEFWLYNEVTLNGETSFLRDTKYHNLGRDRLSDYEKKSYIFLPYTPELLARCEQIALRFDEIQKMIDKSFGTPEKALETLNAQKLLI